MHTPPATPATAPQTALPPDSTAEPQAAPDIPPDAGFAPPPRPVPPGVNLSRWLAVGSLLALIVLGLLWELVLAPLRPEGSLLALKVLPLCLPIAGLLKNRMYTYRWLSLMIWLWFIEGVVRAWGDKSPGNWLALLQVVLCLVLFAACVAHIRLRQRHAARQSASPTAS